MTAPLMVTLDDLQLELPRLFVHLFTFKQRGSDRGRPAKALKVTRVVPLLDATFVRKLHRYLVTFRPIGLQ
jgi:hypothetical protein